MATRNTVQHSLLPHSVLTYSYTTITAIFIRPMSYLVNQDAQKGDECLPKFITNPKKHTKPELFKCTFCNKVFTERKNLLVHERRHTNDFKSKCIICNKGAPSKSRLATHILSHTDLKLYECSVCHKRYKHKYTRDLHMKKIHKLQYAAKEEKIKIVLITVEKGSLSADPHPGFDNVPLNNTNPKDAELLQSFDKFMSGQTFKIVKVASAPSTRPDSTGPIGGSIELNELSDTSTWGFTFNDATEKHKLFNHAPISMSCLT